MLCFTPHKYEMAHETTSYAKYGAKLFWLFAYQQGNSLKKTNNRFYTSSEPFSRKNISNSCLNNLFLWIQWGTLDFDQLTEVENKLRNRHCKIHYYENSINAYQLVSREHSWLIVFIICMIRSLPEISCYIW
jgi:hypothetical protein